MPDLWPSFTAADSAFLGFINDLVRRWRGTLPLFPGDRSQRASTAIYFQGPCLPSVPAHLRVMKVNWDNVISIYLLS